MDLSVIIAGREEEFFQKTIENVLENSRGNTEVIAICDGNWPDPPIQDHPRVTIVHHTESIGQRAAVNEGARISKSKYIMKLDAHCAVSEGFDVQLMNVCKRRNWTIIPVLYNLHAFQWVCSKCGKEYYQADRPDTCCDVEEFTKRIIWKPRRKRKTVSWRFDKDLHFQYWHDHQKRPEAQGQLIETMCNIGAAWFIHREQFFKQDCLDEAHGSYGQMGVEISCKAWLSGGKVLTCKDAWAGHMFRSNGNFSFPYPISGNDQERAKQYSIDFWRGNKWSKQKYPLRYLVERFWPVNGWTQEDLDKLPCKLR